MLDQYQKILTSEKLDQVNVCHLCSLLFRASAQPCAREMNAAHDVGIELYVSRFVRMFQEVKR